MCEISFIHLSDIHFKTSSGNSYDIDSDLRNAILIDVKNNLLRSINRIEGVLLGGDIAFAGQKEEYGIANEFLGELAECLGMKNCDIFCVPGNHDVNQNISRKSRSIYTAQCDIDSAQSMDEADRIIEKYMLDQIAPDLLFKTIEEYNIFAEPYGCNIASNKPIWEKYFDLDNCMKLKIVGLNSCIISNQDDHKNGMENRKMVIGQSQIPHYDKNSDNVVCVSLCHHPTEFWKFIDLMKDRLDKRVDIQLYGHKYEQAISKNNERLVINAGATQPTRGSDWKPRYNWISFQSFYRGGDRYIRVKTYPRVLSKDRDCFVPDKENCDDDKNYFVYELNIDDKRRRNLCDYNTDSMRIHEKNLLIDGAPKDMIYDFLELSDVQRFQLLSELQLYREEYGGKRPTQIVDSVLEDAKKANCLDKFHMLIRTKKN